MLVSVVVSPVSFANSLNRSTKSVSALALLLTLIASSCGYLQTSGNNKANVLALSDFLPAGTVNQHYNAAVTVKGGSPPYQFSVVSGSIPPGISLNQSTGSLSGTPTSPGTFAFAISVTDSPAAGQGKQTFVVQISNALSEISVSISPISATLTSGGQQQFTATVAGSSNTAVVWTASSGSIDSNGLYTAPSVQSGTAVVVTATSQASSTQAAQAAVTVNPYPVQPLEITTTSLPQGQQGTGYGDALATTGGTAPYSWTVSSGSLPTGLTLSASGEIAGIPSGSGTSSFAVTVMDAEQLTASANFTMTINQSSGYDGPAQLPLITMAVTMADTPAPGSVINVSAGEDLQAALNQATCGQTIQLQAGATFNGKFKVPAKNCDINHWIIIRTSAPDSALPPEGTRLTPCYAGVASLVGRPAYNCHTPQNVLAQVLMDKRTDGPFEFEDGANFYRFTGLEITRLVGIRGPAKLLMLLGTADHIIVDRSWLHGQAQDQTYGGFQASGGTYIAVIDSYLNDFHCISLTGGCTDAHAVAGGTSPTQDGPYLIQNNFLEASGEAVMFGGGPATATPADITIQQNHFWKPWQWMPGNPNFVGGPDGNPFIVKNHLELKNAQRVLIQDNLMENNWGGFTQHGTAVLMTPVNQYAHKVRKNVCPLCKVTDVTIRYCHISHAAGGIDFATALSPNIIGAPAALGTRFSIHDVVIDDISRNYVGGGHVFGIGNGWPQNPINTITINHVTAFPDPDSHFMVTGNLLKNPQMYGFVFTNNLVVAGAHPIWDSYGAKQGPTCSQSDVPLRVIQTCFISYTFQNNGIIATPSKFPASVWPESNFFPDSPDAVQFTDFNNGNGGNYQLLPSSPFKNKGTDGEDLGADIIGLQQQLANVE